MKHLRLGVLAIAMALAAASLALAGTASATVLCKGSTTPCGADYAAFTEFKVEQMPGNTSLWYANGMTVDTCENSLMLGKTQNTGGSGSAVKVSFTTFTWGLCEKKAKKISELGELEIKSTAEGKGTLFLTNIRWEEGSCVFGGKNADIGVITKPEVGKTYSTFLVDAKYPLISGLGCPATMTWAATYKVTAPTPLYIAES
jgi:hypothetical protein